jgi:hypothetical protein
MNEVLDWVLCTEFIVIEVYSRKKFFGELGISNEIVKKRGIKRFVKEINHWSMTMQATTMEVVLPPVAV